MPKKPFDISAHNKTLETLVALDAGFGCLLDNIKNIHPTLAQSLAIDLQQTAQQIPLHLPPNAHGAADILERWATILKNLPSTSNPAQHN